MTTAEILLSLYLAATVLLMAIWKVNNPDIPIVQAVKAIYRSVFYGKN